jgi:hypothetical protein
MEHLIDALFDLSPQVRYVAVYRYGELSLRQRRDLSLASAAQSDRYEELLVNPTVLTLTRQRGDIDCGRERLLLGSRKRRDDKAQVWRTS